MFSNILERDAAFHWKPLQHREPGRATHGRAIRGWLRVSHYFPSSGILHSLKFVNYSRWQSIE